jgi:hypothetical protein
MRDDSSFLTTVCWIGTADEPRNAGAASPAGRLPPTIRPSRERRASFSAPMFARCVAIDGGYQESVQVQALAKEAGVSAPR